MKKKNLSIKNLDYLKIKEKIYDEYSYTIHSLSKFCDLSKYFTYKFFNPDAKHNYWQDLYVLIKICNKFDVNIQTLIA